MRGFSTLLLMQCKIFHTTGIFYDYQTSKSTMSNVNKNQLWFLLCCCVQR